MKIRSASFSDQEPIPHEFAFGRYDTQNHVVLSDNRNPHLHWEGAPENTQSFAIVCCDIDVPSQGDTVNQEGKVVPIDLPRIDFYHWILVDVPKTKTEIQAAELCDGISQGGKSGPESLAGMRQGVNDYTQWFAEDQDMRGTYFGYDGPCPPWNDERIHRYEFRVFALDTPKLPLEGHFNGEQAMATIAKHKLAEAKITGTYAIYPQAKPTS